MSDETTRGRRPSATPSATGLELWVFGLYCLLALAALGCTSKSVSKGSDAGDPSVDSSSDTATSTSDDDEIEDEIEEGEAPQELTGVYLVGTDNARARCEFQRSGGKTFKLICKAVVVVGQGKEFVAQGIAESTTLAWKAPVALDGKIDAVTCEVADDALSQICSLTSQTATARVKVDLAVEDTATDVRRTESSIVLLPFSVGVAAGFVPTVPILYKSVAPKAGNGGSGLALAEGAAPGGFQMSPFAVDRVTVNSGAFCARGDETFFASEGVVFKAKGGSAALYAGTSNQENPLAAATLDRFRFHLGWVIDLVCPAGSEDVYAVFIGSEIVKIPAVGPVVMVGELAQRTGEETAATYDGELARDKLPHYSQTLALSPEGELHLASVNGIFKIDGDGRLRLVFDGPCTTFDCDPPTDLAFAADGALFFVWNNTLYRVQGGKASKVLGAPLPGGDDGEGLGCPEIGSKLPETASVQAALPFGDDLALLMFPSRCLMRVGSDLTIKAAMLTGSASKIEPAGAAGVLFAGSGEDQLFTWDFVSDPKAVVGAQGSPNEEGTPGTSAFLKAPVGVAYDGDLLLIADLSPDGLGAVDRSGKFTTAFSPLLAGLESRSYAWGVAVGSDGTYYFRQGGDLRIMRTGQPDALVYDDRFADAFVASPDGFAYVASFDGVLEVRPDGSILKSPKTSGNVQSVALGPAGDLFWSSGNEIFRRDATGKVKSIRDPSPSSGDGVGGMAITGLAVANDGTVYFRDIDSTKLRSLRRVAGASYWEETVVFGSDRVGAECGAGVVTAEAAAGDDFETAFKASASLLCAGRGGGMAIKDTCPSEGGSTRIAFTQLFGLGGNVVEFVMPCGQ